MSDGGRAFSKTGRGISHAATSALVAGIYHVKIEGAEQDESEGELGRFYVGVAAVGKDISLDRDLFMDAEVWLMDCGNGLLCSDGSYSSGTAAAAGELELEFAPAEGTATLRQAGKELSRLTGVPPAVKLVVCTHYKGQTATLF